MNFILDIVEGHVGFVKFQSAYFEACGPGLSALSSGMKGAREAGIAVILDAKRGDTGATAAAYARACLTPDPGGGGGDVEADCLTVNPLMGPDTPEPFVDCASRHGRACSSCVEPPMPAPAGIGWQAIALSPTAWLNLSGHTALLLPLLLHI